MNGEKVDSASQLTAAIRAQKAFAEVELTVIRDGKEIKIPVTLGDAEAAN